MSRCGSLWAGLLYSVPFGCWFFVLADHADTRLEVAGLVADAFRILVLVQAFAAALLHPALQCGDMRRNLSAVLGFFAIPWPLLVVFFLAGDIHGMLLGLSQLALVIGTLGMIGLAGLGQRAAWPALRWYAPAAVQLTGVALVLSASPHWLQWTG
ncbi:MAG: hypothetical protein LJE59_03040 [Chromatiaceae bacterium]|nr:hypothetical protein [Chromatiaceae bacterium]